MSNESDQIPWDEIREHLFSGRRIEAIKAYRMATEADLKASKEFIDELEGKMREEFPDHFKASNQKGCVGVLLLLVGVAILSGLLLAVVG